MVTEKELREMEFHETKDIVDNVVALRVKGGWIYWNSIVGTHECSMSGVFVSEASPYTLQSSLESIKNSLNGIQSRIR